jgi:steroid Delta-isomerase
MKGTGNSNADFKICPNCPPLYSPTLLPHSIAPIIPVSRIEFMNVAEVVMCQQELSHEMLQTTIQTTIATYFAAMRSLDTVSWVNTFADNAIGYEPSMPPLEGRQALERYFAAIANHFDRIELVAESIVTFDNEVAVQWSAQAVSRQGHCLTFSGLDLFAMNPDGKIQTLWAYWNPAAVMAELNA